MEMFVFFSNSNSFCPRNVLSWDKTTQKHMKKQSY